MPRTVTVAATQMSCSWDREANIAQAEKLVRDAAAQGAQIILIQELFETPYFCQKPNADYLQLATAVDNNPAIAPMKNTTSIPVTPVSRCGKPATRRLAWVSAGISGSRNAPAAWR